MPNDVLRVNMGHGVFICYDERDRDAGDAVYSILKDNNIDVWYKPVEMSEGDPVDKITSAIEECETFLLVLSKNSKDTNYVITETDIAFSREIPIIVFCIDDAKLSGNMEYILQTPIWIDSFPDCKMQLETLVRKISNNSVTYPKVDSSHVKVFEKTNPNRRNNIIRKYARMAIPIVLAVLFIYFAVILPMGQMTTDDGVFAMDITHVDVSGSEGNFKYVVYGESYNLPADKEMYFMNIRFLDDYDNLVYEINSTADEFKSGKICTGYLKTDNVTHIGFKLSDLNDHELCSENYVIG